MRSPKKCPTWCSAAIAVTVRRVLEIQLKAAALARRDAALDGARE
jgi:hypothetical protein